MDREVGCARTLTGDTAVFAIVGYNDELMTRNKHDRAVNVGQAFQWQTKRM